MQKYTKGISLKNWELLIQLLDGVTQVTFITNSIANCDFHAAFSIILTHCTIDYD